MTKTILSQSDEWATVPELFQELCHMYGFIPYLDVSASINNTKCYWYFTECTNALERDWKLIPLQCYWKRDYSLYDGLKILKTDIWCNPPHSKTKAFVLKAHEQWQKHNLNIMMLVPVGTTFRNYFQPIRDDVEVHKVLPRPSFIHESTTKATRARQDYVVIIWRKKIEHERTKDCTPNCCSCEARRRRE